LAAFFLWAAITLAATLWHARATDQMLSPHWNQWSRIISLLISALPLLFWGCEEIVLRGLALPRLLVRSNALVASIILGLVWGAWHLPMFIWNIKGLNPGMPFYIYVAFTVSISVVMTWLLNHTQGSLLVAIFFHFWINQWPRYQYALLPVEDTGGSAFVTSIWLLAAFAVLVVVVYGYRSFNRNPERSALTELTTSQA
jgi:membrane protease YdiL (CAAX protease family)